jgi:hypothetical protein
MAATWVILGTDGVRQYERLRQMALGKLLKTIREDGHPLLVSQRLTAKAKPETLDCFHDGTNVLAEVADWHALLRDSARRLDPITRFVLDLVDDSMLLRDPKQRIRSKQLCEELKRIVSTSGKIVTDTMAAESPKDRTRREHMEKLLHEIDREAETRSIEEDPAQTIRSPSDGRLFDRDALEVKLDNVALKETSHRHETIPTPGLDVPNTIAKMPDMSTSGVLEVMDAREILEDNPRPTFMDKRKTSLQTTIPPSSRSNTSP